MHMWNIILPFADVLLGLVSQAHHAAQVPCLLLNKAAKEDASGRSCFGSQVNHGALVLNVVLNTIRNLGATNLLS